jgi:ABC-2 type transport system ATP-binding protein
MKPSERSPSVESSPPILALESVSVWYGEVIGLNDVDVRVGPGVTGLLGPNGAGKTTMIRLVTGQIPPNKGRVEVLGREPFARPDLYRDVGLCPDLDAFYESMTGLELVTYLARLSGFGATEARRRALDLLDRVRLTDAKDRKLGGYSKGMRQRVKLAQALVHDPRLLVLDEPLTGLDPVGRREVIDLVRELADEGRHLLVSSHILHEVEAMTSRVLLIHRGRILADGEVHEIRALIDEHPHHVEIRCDDARSLARRLLEFDDVVRVSLDPSGDGRLVVETVRPEEFYGRMPEIVLASGVKIEKLASPDDNLEAVFHYLVR